MTKKELEEFKKRIMDRLAFLRARNKSSTIDAPPGIPLDGAERGSLEADRSLMCSIKEKDLKEIVKLEAVLVKIRKGTFGICGNCEGEIGKKRLEIAPDAELCIGCQSAEEKVIRGQKRREAFFPSRPL